MSDYTALFSEQWECLNATYTLGAAAAAVVDTGNLDCGNMHRMAIIIHPMDINDVLDIDVEQASDTTAGTRKTISAAEFDTSIAIADTKPTVIEVPTEAMDVDGGFKYLNVECTFANTGGSGNDFVIEVWGLPRYKPAATTNLDSVVHT